jgi:uncharacterized metal-binding protein
MAGTGRVALLYCGGASLRGLLSARVSKLVAEQFDEFVVVAATPAMAREPAAVADLQGADKVIAVAGCQHRCERVACQRAIGREPDDEHLLTDITLPEVRESFQLSPDALRQAALEASTRLIGKVGEL